MDLEARVRRLEDRQAVKQLRWEYARRVDDEEWEAWVDLFTADATCSFEGWGEPTGRDELLDYITNTVAGSFEFTSHLMHNPVIELDGDTGTGEWVTEIYYAYPDGRAGWRIGRYYDEYERVDGEWLFSAVAHTFDARQRFEFTIDADTDFGKLVEYGAPVGE